MPKFHVGDMIQSGGAPHVVFQVKEVKIRTYTLAPPDDDLDWQEFPHEQVDNQFNKNAREFKRQWQQHFDKKFNPLTPGFDKEGFPTYEENR